MDGLDLKTVFMRDFSGTEQSLSETIRLSLSALRHGLDMDVAFLSEFKDGRRILRGIDQRAGDTPVLLQGTSEPLAGTLCKRVAAGELPTVMEGDAAPSPYTSYVCQPIQRPNGDVLGVLGCGSKTRTRRVTSAERRLLRALATLILSHIGTADQTARLHEGLGHRLTATLTGGRFRQLFQPIVRIRDMRTVGYEALTRFPDLSTMSTQAVFDAARAQGLGPHFEFQAARRIVERTRESIAQYGFIALNFSHHTLLMETLETLYEWGCEGLPEHGYVIEISEQEAVDNFDILREVMRRMRGAGLRLAIDDVGAGQAGLRHILQLEPDMIKIDRSVTAEIVDHRASRAMVSALTSFGAQTDCDIVCEGVETVQALDILRDLGAHYAQGYLLGRPSALPCAALPMTA